MRPHRTLLALIGLILAACASEPPLRDQPAPPPSIAGLAQDRVGPFRLDQRPTSTWAALQAGPPFEKTWRRGHVAFVSFTADSPVHAIAYLFDRSLSADSYEEADLRLVYVEVPTEGEQGQLLAELDAAGLTPRSVVGVDKEQYLLLDTAHPDWFVRYREDRLTGLVRQLPDQPLREVLDVADLDALQRLAADGDLDELGALLTAADCTSAPGNAAWYDTVAALRTQADDALVEPFRNEMSTVDRRMAKATDLPAKLKVFVDMYPVVKRASHGRKSPVQPVLDWAATHREAFFAQMDTVFDGEAKKSTAVWGVYRFIREALDLDRWTNVHIDTPQWHAYQPGLEFAVQWAGIRDADPYRELARRLRWLPNASIPRSTRRYYYAEASRTRCVARRRAGTTPAWEQEILPVLERATFPNNNAMRRWADTANAASAAHRLFAQRPTGLDAECRLLAALPDHLTGVPGLRKPVWTEAAKRLESLALAADDDLDHAVAQALAATLRTATGPEGRNPTTADIEAAGQATACAPALLAAVRGLPRTGDVEQRIAAYASLANRGSEFGPVAERIAGELSVPAGRTLAEEAARAAAEGHHGFAALQWLRAATLGSRTAPAPVSSWQARRAYSALLAARKSDAPPDIDERTAWLIEARAHAYAATVALLPRLAPSEPVYDLQNRFVSSQLAGRCRLPLAFGVRLGGMSDVRRGRDDSKDRRLGRAHDRILWLGPDEEGEAVDLANYRIDAAGWRELREKRAELDQVEADLDAARSTGGSSKAALQERDRALSAKAQALQKQLQAGAVDPGIAQGEIARLKRESNALNAAIANFNDRNRHINSLVQRFNALVGPHNELLEKLLAQQATAYEQLLRPATDSYVEIQVQGGTLEPRERRARRWLMGLADDPEFESLLPQPHPSALAQRVRDVSDPAVAAADILGALRRRRDDTRLWRGVTVGEHIDALRGALTAYGAQYGVDELHRHIMKNALVPASEHIRIVGYFQDKRQAALRKLVESR